MRLPPTIRQRKRIWKRIKYTNISHKKNLEYPIREQGVQMSDNEIIKALECCGEMHECSVCPRYDRSNDFCMEDLHADALDLINRQKAEIERLRGSTIVNNIMKSQRIKREAKAEAVKEFAERLKEKAITYYTIIGHWVSVKDIDNLVKEMVGDKE